MKFLFGTVACCFLAAATLNAKEILSSSESMQQFGVDIANTEITTETIAPGLHVLFGAGGNIVASIGEQGVLIVDDQVPAMVPKIVAAVAEFGGSDINFVINTHWHHDHANGNPVLAESGSWIVAHQNSRDMLLDDQRIDLVSFMTAQPPHPADALPVITYEDRMRFYFNGEAIDLLHFGAAHTTGDTAVVFRKRKVVHMGDVFNSRYPFIDAGNGGSIDGVIRFCESVLDEIDEEYVFVPGHGRVSNFTEFAEYVSMLKTVRDRVAELIAEGATLEEVIAANPTAEWDEARGNPGLLLDRAYLSLHRDGARAPSL